MTIGLVDVDGRVMHGKRKNGERYPNLALMKLSAWHKAQGDAVEFAFPLARYDRIYMSKIFTFSPDDYTAYQCEDIRKGGTGYGLDNKLPDEVEHTMPDYTLYGATDTAYGFLSRGCPRGCPFCIVAEKEGRASRKVANLREWWDGQRNINLLDPNILACPDWRDLLGQLADSRARVNYSQGLDIRLLTDEKLDAVLRTNVKTLHFAWDGNEDLSPLFAKHKARVVERFGIRRVMVYVLTNYNTTHDYDMHRVYTLRDMGYDPYVMVYDKDNAPMETRKLQRWVNNKPIFRTINKFENFDSRKG